MRILVGEPAVDHVGHGFESAVGVPAGPTRFAGLVFDLAHLVHVDKGVEIGLGDACEGSDDRETLTLIPTRSGGHRPDGSLGVRGDGAGDAGQGQGIGCDGGHDVLLRWR